MMNEISPVVPTDNDLERLRLATSHAEEFSEAWFTAQFQLIAAEQAREAAALSRQPERSLLELQRERKERLARRRKMCDLREQFIALTKTCRLSRKVRLEDLDCMTENQLRMGIKDLQAIADHRAQQEIERFTPDGRIQEYKRLKGRQGLRNGYLAKRHSQRSELEDPTASA